MNGARALLAAILLLAGALRFVAPDDVADLKPRPDALGYHLAAEGLARGEGPGFRVEGALYPPIHPPGAGVLFVPPVALLGGRLGAGVLASLVLGVLGVLAAYALGAGVANRRAGLAAAALVALAPLHVRLSKSVMSDVPSTAALGFLLAAALRARRDARGPGAWFLLGAGAGLAAAIRLPNVLVVVPLAVLALRPRLRAPAPRSLAALGAGLAAGLLPLLLFHAAWYGSPFGSGYAYWRFPPYGSAGGSPLRRAFEVDAGGESGLAFYAASLLGFRSLWPWPVVPLLLAGGFAAWRAGGVARAFVVATAVWTAASAGLGATYFTLDERFLLPLLPCAAALAALPLVTGSRPRRAFAALLLAAGAWVSRDAFASAVGKPRGPWLYGPEREEVDALSELARRVEPNAALLLRTDYFLFERVVRPGTDRLWIPLDRCEIRDRIRRFGLEPVARFDAPRFVVDLFDPPADPERVSAALRELAASGRPLYLSAFRAFEASSRTLAMRPAIERAFVLEPVGEVGGAPLYRLAPRS